MDNNFHIFPSETFIDLCLYQYGHEKCTPGHLFGPATRNHYLFHYVLSGTGTLMATNSKGQNINYQVRSGQGFMIFPGQITTYVADIQVPWEYVWVEFDGLRTTEILNVCGFSKDACSSSTVRPATPLTTHCQQWSRSTWPRSTRSWAPT